MQILFRTSLVSVVMVMLAACVTINVYFPAAAAERAADEFIRDVLGSASNEETGMIPALDPSHAARMAYFFLSHTVPSAQAQQADIDIDAPAVNAIKLRMAQRQQNSLQSYFGNGAIGSSNDGLVQVRDRSAVSLQQRRELERLVADENRDRQAVYREIAVANGHPDWEAQIRATFARRWISNAKPGWYYQDEEDNWVQK